MEKKMDSFRKMTYSVSAVLNWVAALSVISMTALTCVDVVLRLFKHPILGSVDMVAFMGAVAAGFAMAQTTVEKGHVAVEFLVQKLSKRTQGIIDSITSILGIFLFGILTRELIIYGNDMYKAGEVSLTRQIPLYPFIYGLALSSFAVCLVLLINFFSAIAKIKGD